MHKMYSISLCSYTSLRSGGAAAGGLFWQLLTEGMESFRDGYEIILNESPSTTNMIVQLSQKLNHLTRMYARLKNIERLRRARSIRRAQWLAGNKGRTIGN